jgi:hypothetical protein
VGAIDGTSTHTKEMISSYSISIEKSEGGSSLYELRRGRTE